MSELLTQQEIDALLSDLKEEGQQSLIKDAEKEPVLFDFRLPNRISKHQLRILENIFNSFSEGFSAFLVSKLQTVVNINITSVEQIYYSEYVLSVVNPACLYKFHISGTDVKAILEINPNFALVLVDKLLGGTGSTHTENKPITQIEQNVLSVVVESVMQNLKKAWQTVDNYDFVVEGFESDVDFAQITSQSESVLLVSMEILIGDHSYMMSLCFATFAFDSILSKLSAQQISPIRPTKYNGKSADEILTKQLYETELPVTVEFGKTRLLMSDLMNLEVGDIIKLENKISDEQIVKVANKVMFLGRVGEVNKHKAIKITNKLVPKDHSE